MQPGVKARVSHVFIFLRLSYHCIAIKLHSNWQYLLSKAATIMATFFFCCSLIDVGFSHPQLFMLHIHLHSPSIPNTLVPCFLLPLIRCDLLNVCIVFQCLSVWLPVISVDLIRSFVILEGWIASLWAILYCSVGNFLWQNICTFDLKFS